MQVGRAGLGKVDSEELGCPNAENRKTAWEYREARFEMLPHPLPSNQYNKAQGDTLGYTVFRQ